MEEEHEVYGGDIPDEVEGDIEGDSDGEPDDLLLKGDDIATDEVASKELEEMKKTIERDGGRGCCVTRHASKS
jgi:polyadenylate-binding protein 2